MGCKHKWKEFFGITGRSIGKSCENCDIKWEDWAKGEVKSEIKKLSKEKLKFSDFPKKGSWVSQNNKDQAITGDIYIDNFTGECFVLTDNGWELIDLWS